jgi:hypothetical protein
MEAYAKGTLDAVHSLERRIRLTVMRDWVYALDDEFQVRFKDIASDTSFDTDDFSGVAEFTVIVDDAKVIEADLLPWFKTRDFKCVSIDDRENRYSTSDSTRDYTLRWSRKVTDEEIRITRANSRWDFQLDKPWEVILKVAFSGTSCTWVDVPTGKYREIPAQPARPARREEVTRKELQC